MPENKKPLLRYMAIDRCLKNTVRHWGYAELLKKVNDDLEYRGLHPIGRTTFYNDITVMEVEFGAPIERIKQGNRTFFKYSDPEYSFGNQPLNQGEIDHLMDAVHILSRFSGIPGFEWIDDLVSKLELGTYEEAGDPNVISFDSSAFLKGKEFIGPLFTSITNKQALEIKYQTFEGEVEKTHLIHPYHLKEYDNRWYVLGYLPKKDDIITLSVDRINEIIIRKDIDFIENMRFDFVEYFEDMIGVRKEKEAEAIKIVLKFSPLMADFVLTKPLHGSQKIVEKGEDGSLTISIEVIPNHEVNNLIFSFKNDVEVLAPDSFRLKIIETYKATIAKYE